jgi:hypothetical protein
MRPVCQKWTSELGGGGHQKRSLEQNMYLGPASCLPANTITSHVDNAFVRLGVQLRRLAHVDLMSFVREQRRVRLRRLELGHDR